MRQVYYRLVAALIVKNNIYEYQAVVKALRDGRLQGTIPFNAIEDRTRQFIGGDTKFRHPAHHFNEAGRYFTNCEDYFNYPRWRYQPYYIEVWLEKEALAALFEEITNELHVRLAPCRGYPSLTFLWEGAVHLKDIGEEIHIIYFGDFDPTGLDIPRHVESMLKRFGLNITFTRIALTQKQIEAFNLPPMPAKHTDSRAAKFITQHGETSAVELDALEPNILQDMIQSSINQYFDEQLYKVVLKEEREAREQIKVWREDQIHKWATKS